MKFPELRPRRLRYNNKIRQMVKETQLSIDNFIYPIFISEIIDKKQEIRSMPEIYQFDIDTAVQEAMEVETLGIPAVILFGIPEKKDPFGSSAYDSNGIIQKTIRALKENTNLYIITDVCLCEYTDHGHCGIIKNNYVDNDETLKHIAKQALSHVQAGADMVAPSCMMDGQIKTMRETLDKNGYETTAIMSYASKFASKLYDPFFKHGTQSVVSFGDKKSYQME